MLYHTGGAAHLQNDRAAAMVSSPASLSAGHTRLRQRPRLYATMTSQASLVSLALGGLVALAAAMGIGRFAYTPILRC